MKPLLYNGEFWGRLDSHKVATGDHQLRVHHLALNKWSDMGCSKSPAPFFSRVLFHHSPQAVTTIDLSGHLWGDLLHLL